MRRFWDVAGVAGEPGAFRIVLDGKPLKIPGRTAGGAPLAVAGRALAEAIAAEWQAAGGEKGGQLTMDAVPLTRLAGTAQDRIGPNPGPVAAELARYAESDLLCYRAERPEALVVRQARAWQPWLDWLERRHGARLEVAEGVVHRAQDPVALGRVHAVMAGMSPLALAALGIAVPGLGSAVLGLALAEGVLDAEEAHRLAHLDEFFQNEQWGADLEATRRQEAVAEDLALAERFLRLSSS